jgi:hypothetical protein
MSEQTLKLVVFGALLVHGFGHGGALGALVWLWRFPASDTGGWRAARSWALPSLSAPAATVLACAFWVVALVGFVAAALSFWDILLPGAAYHTLAAVTAVVSSLGIVLFLGTWPAFNTLAALAMNVVVLAALLWLRWPASSGLIGLS